MAEVKDMVKSNVVSQVPYFITFAYENAETKPQIKLTELFRYYNNQTTAIPLYGATNISATFNGKHAEWNYKEITLTGAVTSTVKEAPVFSNEDENSLKQVLTLNTQELEKSSLLKELTLPITSYT